MAYDGRIMRRALQRFEADRREREERFAQREESIYRRSPRLREIDQELRDTMRRIITSALRRGTDPHAPLQALRDRNLSLQKEKAALLAQLGLPADCLENKPACALCGDTGYRGGEVCRCLREYYAREQQKELSRMLDLGAQSFETFSLDWYSQEVQPELGLSPRENMKWVLRTCRSYAENFGERSGSLLMTGAPGLGKTFLSACIAREVSDGGFSVVYDTAAHIFSRFEAEKFRDDAAAQEDAQRVLRCDLLILDDLGTEMTTAFVISALYRIVNTRLLERRATILSTNLRAEELAGRYSPQIASRVEGDYQILPFFGRDIRQLKRERQ
jgi:DNA replication protein DnaC